MTHHLISLILQETSEGIGISILLFMPEITQNINLQ
jgi:hypothetical protein